MLPLLVAFLFLAVAFRRLLRPPSASHCIDARESDKGDKRSSVHVKLVDEAFEFASNHDYDVGGAHPILVLYATEYGFALQVARSVAETLSSAENVQLYPRLVNVMHFHALNFSRENFVILVCSTTGDGVPPNEAAAFREALESSQLSIPPTIQFAVLALGDRAYPHFCRAGAIFDQLFTEQLDGSNSQLLPRQDIDQEDWETINDWTERLRDAIISIVTYADKESNSSNDSRVLKRVHPKDDYLHNAIEKYAKTLSSAGSQYSRNNPFPSRVSLRRKLTAPAVQSGEKEVVRIEVDITGSGLSYEVGDAIGVVPQNNPALVNRILRALASNGDESVTIAEGVSVEKPLPASPSSLLSTSSNEINFETALLEHLDLAMVKPALVITLARFSASGDEVNLARKILGFDPRDPVQLGSISSSKSSVVQTDFGKVYMQKRHVIDVLSDFPTASISAQQLVDTLRPLHARYYSISSTPATCPNTIAMTIDIIRYRSELDDTDREGVASTFLNDRCRLNETVVPVFLSRNPNFRLPNDPKIPIVMIGPGTGIAPFIGFIEHRVATGANGENWLFFGCRFERQDFLYRDELANFVNRGHLVLKTAFSRDSDVKVYVQQRMKECGETLWKLINDSNAHVYVCGDGARMANDVDEELHHIVMQHGNLDHMGAGKYISDLQVLKRYQRDVWVS